MFGPVLRGALVTLSPPTPDDLPNYVRWFADVDVTRDLLCRNGHQVDGAHVGGCD